MRVRNEHDREIGVVAEWLTLYRNLATQICWTSTNYYLGEGADALRRSNDVNSSRSTSETGMTTTSSFRSTPPTRFRVLDFRLAAHLGDGHVQLLGLRVVGRRPDAPVSRATSRKPKKMARYGLLKLAVASSSQTHRPMEIAQEPRTCLATN
jgi:hypothetical protein